VRLCRKVATTGCGCDSRGQVPFFDHASRQLCSPLDQIVSIEYRRGELEIKRRHGTLLRIGNLDGIGALLELSDALAA
jgi:hypothetical protein